MYSGLELQWILLSLYYITGKSFIFTLRPYYHFGAGINVINSPRGVYRGIYNYLIQNAMLGIKLIFGLIYSNIILFFISIFGKIGYFPFHFLYISFWLCSSYMFLIYDVFPKLAYFVCIYVIPLFTTYFNSFSFRIRLAQLVGFHFFAKFIITNKHPLIIPTLLTYFLVTMLLILDDAEFSPSFLAAYSLTMINILTYLERSGSSFWRSSSNSALAKISNLKLWIVIIASLATIHYLVQFSFFPTNMRFNKSFSFTFYISNSVSFSINITVFMPFTYQVLLLRSILFVLYIMYIFSLCFWRGRYLVKRFSLNNSLFFSTARCLVLY